MTKLGGEFLRLGLAPLNWPQRAVAKALETLQAESP
jgi:hypothetical protein